MTRVPRSSRNAPENCSGPKASGVRQRHYGDALGSGRCKERRVRRCDRIVEDGACCEQDAVAQGQRDITSSVPTGADRAGQLSAGCIDRDDIQAARTEEFERAPDLVDRSGLDADEDIHDLGEVDRGDAWRAMGAPEKGLDLGRRRLIGQRRDERLGVENAQDRPQRRDSASTSSRRSCARTLSVFGPPPASEPMADPIGSAGSGRSTRYVP